MGARLALAGADESGWVRRTWLPPLPDPPPPRGEGGTDRGGRARLAHGADGGSREGRGRVLAGDACAAPPSSSPARGDGGRGLGLRARARARPFGGGRRNDAASCSSLARLESGSDSDSGNGWGEDKGGVAVGR